MFRNKTDTHIRKSEQRCKQYYDRAVRETPAFHTRENAFFDKRSLSNLSDSKAETLARSNFKTFLSHITGPIRILSVEKNKITTGEDGIPNTVRIDNVTHAPVMTKKSHYATKSVQPKLDSANENTPSEAHDNNTGKGKYIIEWIIRNIDGKDTHRCV